MLNRRPVTTFIRIAGFGLLLGALIGTSGIASAKPEPAPFEPGSKTRLSRDYGPCQLAGDDVDWKCIHFKRQEVQRLNSGDPAGCADISVYLASETRMYWRCTLNR